MSSYLWSDSGALTSKVENLFKIKPGDLYYAPNFGLDYDYFVLSSTVFSKDYFLTFIKSELVKFDIPVNHITGTINKGTLEIEMKLNNQKYINTTLKV